MSDAVIGGRYRLLERLASGGMGSVWKAWDERLQRTVAVKQLHVQPGLPEHDAHLATQRALREARNTARLHHPNAVQVYDVVDDDGRPCLVMQYVPSTSLQEIVRTQGARPPAEVARIGTQIAAALAAAHRAGLVHRDVKPGNILIGDDGTAKITDFGISHAFDDVALTSTGMLTGTPAYLAPEVARGAPSTPASDVFSLASTLFMASEGAPPFGTDANQMAVLHRVASGEVTPSARLGPLEPLLRQMMARDPAQRPDMVAVANALSGLVADPGPPPLPAGAAAPLATRVLPVPAQPAPPARRPPMVVREPLPAERERQPSFVLPFVAAAVVVVLGAVLAIVLIHRGSDGHSGAAAQSVQSTRSAATGLSPATTTPPPASRPTSKKPSSRAVSSGSPSRTSASSTAASPPAGTPTARQLVQAVTDYYSLVPGNTEAGWERLTERYRRTTSGGRENYETFWGSMRRVTVDDVVGSPPGTVVATLTYYLNDGTTSRERTQFGVVRDGAVLKIDSSRVI